ncbi:GH92 family glycosyl hydrolase [uncultured Paraglaciecola sp.]|uniref:GH92 family glycosyl hydrolase n=1 Tax=uncultured Paraglaciecola sp. TaxID=1765024 RepID=UPI00262FE203|nr:GH92 family glycosyl hydrolase [uncultured Paraglaciecola sp.]
MKILGYSLVLPILLAACSSSQQPAQTTVAAAHTLSTTDKALLQYVDPLIGTGGHGHTFPGATVPFGMVQLSPDNPSKGWDWTSGYNYSDNQLFGFSHTHLSGTGVGDLLDILVMPFRGDYTQRLDNELNRVVTTYSHDNEQARAGYYSLELTDEKVTAELSVTERTGVHRYSFAGEESAKLLIDLGYAQNYDKPVATFMRVVDDRTVQGYRISTGWTEYQPVYFVVEFNQPFNHQFYVEGKAFDETIALKGDVINTEKSEVVLDFGDIDGQPLVAKLGMSYTSINNAKQNLAAEVNGFDFEQVKQSAANKWAAQLSKFNVEDGDEEAKTVFYTALYHSFLAPQLFNDQNGSYFGADGATHQTQDFNRYTLFSLWDTFRALHPLLTISDGDKINDMVESMLAFYDETGLLPTWDLMSNETDVMIGYHAVPVLVDAYFKGLTKVDPERLYAAIKASAMQDQFGIDLYKKHGYIPSELELEAVSKTLEYAFDDWAIARMAKALGKSDDAAYFSQRANSFKTLFDTSVGFMRGKDAQGQWVKEFSPTHVDHRVTDYTEANAWQYSWFVPHDVPALIELFGGESPFVSKLDQLFSVSSHMEGDVSPDISGLIGQYAHGNEPCHHIPYLYAFTQQKWKGEQQIRQIRQTMYRNGPDGLAGNDDVGQMSAWYVFSALGFYPVNPASGEYVFGTPLFDHVSINVGKGKFLKVSQSGDKQGFVKQVLLNGEVLTVNHITHQQLSAGGELHFILENR